MPFTLKEIGNRIAESVVNDEVGGESLHRLIPAGQLVRTLRPRLHPLQAVGDRDTPMLYLLGEKYILALDRLAASGNSKIVVLPADLQDTLRGILGWARS